MSGCGAADARKLDQCECDLPPGHPAPHRCHDCGRSWHEPRTGATEDVVITDRSGVRLTR